MDFRQDPFVIQDWLLFVRCYTLRKPMSFILWLMAKVVMFLQPASKNIIVMPQNGEKLEIQIDNNYNSESLIKVASKSTVGLLKNFARYRCCLSQA